METTTRDTAAKVETLNLTKPLSAAPAESTQAATLVEDTGTAQRKTQLRQWIARLPALVAFRLVPVIQAAKERRVWRPRSKTLSPGKTGRIRPVTQSVNIHLQSWASRWSPLYLSVGFRSVARSYPEDSLTKRLRYIKSKGCSANTSATLRSLALWRTGCATVVDTRVKQLIAAEL